MYWLWFRIGLSIITLRARVLATPLEHMSSMQQYAPRHETWTQSDIMLNNEGVAHLSELNTAHASLIGHGRFLFPPPSSILAPAIPTNTESSKDEEEDEEDEDTQELEAQESFSDSLLKLITNQLGPQALSLNPLGNNSFQGDVLALSSQLNLTGSHQLPTIGTPHPKVPSCYRSSQPVELTQYWVPRENEWDETNGGERVFLGGKKKDRMMFDQQHQLLGKVTSQLFNKCLMEGTCLLENGDMINIDDIDIPTFKRIGTKGRSTNIFGLGSGPQTLLPFVSVASNDLPYGQKLYISELDGLDLGNGIKHNGCVRVDDSSWSFDDCQLDFFIPTYIDYLWLDVPKTATVQLDDRCTLRNYVTMDHLILMKASLDDAIIPSLLN